MSMLWYQCEQTAMGGACTASGVCGKDSETAAHQDVFLRAGKRVAVFAHRSREFGARGVGVDRFVPKALFIAFTNVNYDPDSLAQYTREGTDHLEVAKALCEEACAKAERVPEQFGGPAA